MKIKKYSKSALNYISSKPDLLIGSQNNIQQVKQINNHYLKGPKRKKCKLCKTDLNKIIPHFCSHGVNYSFCPNCNHLNGECEETLDFVSFLYSDNHGANYSKQYLKRNWNERSNEVYKPKVEFLIDVLYNKVGISNDQISILDVGCGSGGFTFAANQMGLDATGLDISDQLVSGGNQLCKEILGIEPLLKAELKDFYQRIKDTDKNVICAIGVIEHLLEPHLLLEAFKKSNADYLFYLVPMFSFSTILEVAFQEKFPRVLSGGHTHLFTENSIKKMHETWSFNSLGEWRIGLDVADLYGLVTQQITKNIENSMFPQLFHDNFLGIVDDLQSVFDKAHFCSEIHCIISKNSEANV